MSLYFNEIDPFAAEWLERLYPGSVVDRRSIADVQPGDVAGFRRVHCFGGIGGWEHALEIAGWPVDRPVWTGSAPCQPFSCAGQQRGTDDERHLWPEFYRLIRQCRPATVVGEQISSKLGLQWLARVQINMEEFGYRFGAADLPASCISAPHIRQRLFWVASLRVAEPIGERIRVPGCGATGGAAGRVQGTDGERQRVRVDTGAGDNGLVDGLADAERSERRSASGSGLNDGDGPEAGRTERTGGSKFRCTPSSGSWEDCTVIPCRDGKARRAESSIQPLAHGIPCRKSDPRLGYVLARLRELGHGPVDSRQILRDARRNRVGRLRGYGNAIVPEVAAVFIRAFLDAEAELGS